MGRARSSSSTFFWASRVPRARSTDSSAGCARAMLAEEAYEEAARESGMLVAMSDADSAALAEQVAGAAVASVEEEQRAAEVRAAEHEPVQARGAVALTEQAAIVAVISSEVAALERGRGGGRRQRRGGRSCTRWGSSMRCRRPSCALPSTRQSSNGRRTWRRLRLAWPWRRQRRQSWRQAGGAYGEGLCFAGGGDGRSED